MEIDRAKPLAKCPTCGTESTNLSTTWPEPKFLPKLSLDKWKVEWSALSTRKIHNRSCVVCAIVVSVLLDIQDKYGYDLSVTYAMIEVHMIPSTQRYLLAWDGVLIHENGWITSHRIAIEPLVCTPPGIYEPCENIPVDSDSLEVFELAKRWLHNCRTNHTKCALIPEPFNPSRILDVSLEDPKLLLRKDLQNTIEYIALSHCWGTSQPLKTVRHNLDSHRKGIPFEALPATFKDAVKVTRRLGMRYLWIDSLCILQDEDKEDWEREASQMEKVYGNAELVLAATVASSPDDGFLRKRPGFDTGHVSTLLHGQTAPMESRYRIIPNHDYPSTSRRCGPLDGRAWAFQERLLARRYLAYGNPEMRWECRLHTLCECGQLSIDGKRHRRTSNLDNLMELWNFHDRRELWMHISSQYIDKELTVASDRLVALSAVASRFQSNYGDTYLAGLWREDLVYLLEWYVGENSEPTSFYAPSWSWFSVSSKRLFFPLSTNRTHRNISTLVTVMDVSVTTSTENKFGPVSKGFIQFRGKAIEAILDVEIRRIAVRGKPPKNEISSWIKVPSFPDSMHCSLDTPVVAYSPKQDDAAKQKELPARRILHTEIGLRREYPSKYSVLLLPIVHEDTNIRLLVLGPSPRHPGCLERLGAATWRGGTTFKVQEFLTGYEETEMVIV